MLEQKDKETLIFHVSRASFCSASLVSTQQKTSFETLRNEDASQTFNPVNRSICTSSLNN